jgi:hypothetical protein
MDTRRFDTLTRALGAGHSRRYLGRLVGSFLLGGALIVPGPAAIDAQKKGHKKGHKKHTKPKPPTCTPACSGGEACCEGHCKDLVHDRDNCGTCGKPCGVTELCQNGQCVPCDEPLALCTVAGQEQCVDVRSDPNNCGSCGNACPKDPDNPNRNFVCQDRECKCTGKTCNNGRCCPKDFAVCQGDGVGCCSTDFPVFCPNNPAGHECCGAGSTCGGSCGEPCCK